MLRSIFQVAHSCGIDWQTARDWLEAGSLPMPLIVNGWLRWRRSDLDAWLEAGCPQSAPLSENECEPLWIALLAELKATDQGKETV